MSYLERSGKLLVIIGPSGAGKSSVITHLHAADIIVVTPSWTTRPPRPEEAQGTIEHHFVTEAIFKQKESAGFFLEAVQMFGLPYWYGLPKIEKSANKIPVIMLRASLLPLLEKHYPSYLVYQIEDAVQNILPRLSKREAAGQALGSRLTDYQKEITAGRKRADRVFNNDDSIESLAERIETALKVDGFITSATG
jgi:guanylate kinase